MEQQEKDSIVTEVFHKVQMKAVIIGIPAVLALLLGLSPFLKGSPGKKGDEGKAVSKAEIISALKTDSHFIKSIQGEQGPAGASAKFPEGSLFMFRAHKAKGVANNCNNFCRESGFLGCVLSGTGIHYAGSVKLNNASCSENITGDVDCICFR